MKQFAKLFEAHGRQVLILKDTDSDDNLKLSIITRMDDGAELNFGPVFEGENAEADLDTAFERAGQELADAFAKQLEGCKTAFEAAKALAGK